MDTSRLFAQRSHHFLWKMGGSGVVLILAVFLSGPLGAQELTHKKEEIGRAGKSETLAGSSSPSRPALQVKHSKRTVTHQRLGPKESHASSVPPSDKERTEPLAPELMEIAAQIYTGRLQCELGQVVMLVPAQDMPGRFQLTLKKQKYLMTPVLTPTGAVKLEDEKLGAFWIQLANKSMLFNSKLGQRLADDCQGPGQQAVALKERISPPPSLWEPLPRVDH
jgi:hypothetical protein